jgi:signal transduction histidine kinase/ligand-binding sensor domain-containing protein
MHCLRILKTHSLTLTAGLTVAVCILLLWAAPAPALNPSRAISQYAHTTWRMQQGIFPGNPNVIGQTADGYLWVGTKSGLLHFDGVQFVAWNPTDGSKLPSDDIRSLLGSRDGGLWIGTRRGLVEWKDGRLITFPAVSGYIQELLEDQTGAIWVLREGSIGATGPLCRVSAGHVQCFDTSDGIPAEARGGESITIDAQGNISFGTTRMLIRMGPGSPTVYSPAALKSNDAAGVQSLATDPDGSLWVGVAIPGRGLGLQRVVDGVWKPLVTEDLDSSKLGVSALLVDREGALWVGTFDQGILRIDHGKVDRYTASDGLSSNFVARMYEDKEGNLWVVTTDGIDNFRDLRVATWSARQGLTTDNVVSVAAGRGDTIWVGNSGGLDSIRDGKVTSVRMGKGLPGNQVTSVFEDHAGRLWLGIDNGLFVYENGRFREIRDRGGRSTGFIAGITEDFHHDIWAEDSDPHTLLHVHDFTVQQEFPAPQTPSAHSLAADTQGNLWLGLRSGDLARFRDGQAQLIPFSHAVDSQVRQVIVGPDGSVMGATTRLGVVAWRNGKTQTLNRNNGLPCDGINGIMWDLNQNLWLHSACGLVEIDRSEMQHWWQEPGTIVRMRIFDAVDGALPGNAFFDAAARTPDGRLWFANGRILQMVTPADLAAPNPLPPPVRVESILANHKRYSPEGLVDLPQLTGDLEIDYTALSFVAPEKVRFRYRLDGYDKDWQDSGTRRQAFYTNLRPHKYRFEVVACNNDGLWNEAGASASFFIAPAFYQTAWFQVLCYVAAATLAWMFYLVHIRRVNSRLQERLAARIEERERIARDLHDTLLQGFQGLMLRLQSVHKHIPENEPAREMLEKVLDRADEVLIEGRQRVHDLRQGMSGNDLSQSLATWGDELARGNGTRFSVAVLGTPRILDPAVGDDVRRIGLEALTNAFRHASAENIEVEITYETSKLRLTVRDDGIGIDDETLQGGRSGHWGLSGMRERAGKLGAQLAIWSHTGAGTEIDLTIPTRIAFARPRRQRRWLRNARSGGRSPE